MGEKKSITQDLLSFDLDSVVEEGKKKERKSRNKRIAGIAVGSVVCLAVILGLVYTKVIVPQNQYNDAVALFEQEEYQQAIDGFEPLGDYKDSADKVLQTKYAWASSLLAEKAYDEAYAKFEEIKDYSDAADRMKDVRYAEADDYLKSCAYLKAIELFERLGDYKDSQTRVLEANYLWAEDYLKQGQLEGALMYFEKAGDFKDAETRADEVYEMMQIHATAVKLSKTSLSINKGKTVELTATLEPVDTTDTIVSWTSSDEKVATVNGNGVVKAVGYGTATIEVKTSNELIAGCTITVPEPSTTANAPTKVPTSTTPDTGVVYGTSSQLPDSAVPLTKNAVAGVWKSNVYNDPDWDYEYFIMFSGDKFQRQQYSYVYEEFSKHDNNIKYIDTGTYYIDGPNIVVTYRTYSPWYGTTSDWKTETWPVAYIHPGGIRFEHGVSGYVSYYFYSDKTFFK